MFGMICTAYIIPALENPLLKRSSLKEFNHVQQNSSMSRFRKFTENFDEEVASKDENLYPIDLLTIPVHTLMSASDVTCPEKANLKILNTIPGHTVEMLSTHIDHVAMAMSNDAAFMASLGAYLPAGVVPLDDLSLCPEIPIP